MQSCWIKRQEYLSALLWAYKTIVKRIGADGLAVTLPAQAALPVTPACSKAMQAGVGGLSELGRYFKRLDALRSGIRDRYNQVSTHVPVQRGHRQAFRPPVRVAI